MLDCIAADPEAARWLGLYLAACGGMLIGIATALAFTRQPPKQVRDAYSDPDDWGRS